MEIHPVDQARFADLADLFESNGVTRGCWCLSFRLPPKERYDASGAWSCGNRDRLEAFVDTEDPPSGLLAYRDGRCVGWLALGPRSRFGPAVGPRARILVDRDKDEDDLVWLLPCFFVRVGARRAGTTDALLGAAIELAKERGVPAIEGWPLAGSGPHKSDRYYGTEPLFAAYGFRVVARPSPGRVVMRLDL